MKTALFLGVLLLSSASGAVSDQPAAQTAAPAGASAAATDPQPGPGLAIEALEVTPAEPSVDTLCRLTVRIQNRASQPASSLAFAVSVGGRPLPVYGNQIFMQALPPGEVSAVRLYNFWTTETDRPAPADGLLTVEVTLQEARWLEVTRDAEGVEVWQPLGPVPGLPLKKTVTLKLAAGKGS